MQGVTPCPWPPLCVATVACSTLVNPAVKWSGTAVPGFPRAALPHVDLVISLLSPFLLSFISYFHFSSLLYTAFLFFLFLSSIHSLIRSSVSLFIHLRLFISLMSFISFIQLILCSFHSSIIHLFLLFSM